MLHALSWATRRSVLVCDLYSEQGLLLPFYIKHRSRLLVKRITCTANPAKPFEDRWSGSWIIYVSKLVFYAQSTGMVISGRGIVYSDNLITEKSEDTMVAYLTKRLARTVSPF